MKAKKSAASGGKAKTVVANDPEDLKGILKLIGGSKSDWNIVLADQTSLTLWLKHSDKETSDRLIRATVAGLVGIGPKDELALQFLNRAGMSMVVVKANEALG